MNAKEGLKLVLGSFAVYVVVGACASRDMIATGGLSGSSSSGGRSLVDALTDPVAEAKADPNQSGSRLKAKYLVGTDGSKQFVGWRDATLNVDCAFTTASDGTTRCMPSGATITTTYFADSGCAQPLAVLAVSGCAAPAYSIQVLAPTSGSSCTLAYVTRVFPTGATQSGPLYSGTPASCTALSSAEAASTRSVSDFHVVGSELPPSTFVAATVQTDP